MADFRKLLGQRSAEDLLFREYAANLNFTIDEFEAAPSLSNLGRVSPKKR